jgi:hypothetical protein
VTHWILQNNLYSEEGFESLTDALERFGFPYSIHKCVPFVGTLEPEANPPEGPVVVMGSYTLARHAKERGWLPGAWLDNLDFKIQLKAWGERMLNADGTVTTIKNFAAMLLQHKPFFVRPVHDTKAFTGQVFDFGSWTEFRDGIYRVQLDNPSITINTEIMVCEKKEIHSETRTWIVDGKVVTASGYKVGTLKRYTSPEQVDARITDFAQDCATTWSPNRAYVLDVAETPDGLKIVEINNLNSAGFYKADMQRLVQALNELAEDDYGLQRCPECHRDYGSVFVDPSCYLCNEEPE